MPDGSRALTVAIITVDPNEVLKSVGHNRSPALLRDPDEASAWLRETPDRALQLLRPHPNETMGVEPVSMGIKIPGNEQVDIPEGVFRS
jgi:putative SOS response-associated peptidase YedK